MKNLSLFVLFMCCLPAGATTIAVDSTGLMCADSQTTVGDGSKYYGSQKLHKIRDCAVGCAGEVRAIEKFKKWLALSDKDREKKLPITDLEVEALVLKPDGTLWRYYGDYSCRQMNLPFAIGSGWLEAMSAMKAGADAKRAIEITEETDLFTGGAVSTMRAGKEPAMIPITGVTVGGGSGGPIRQLF